MDAPALERAAGLRLASLDTVTQFCRSGWLEMPDVYAALAACAPTSLASADDDDSLEDPSLEEGDEF